MAYIMKNQIIERLEEKIDTKEPIIVCTSTNGLIAQAAIDAGIDFLVVDFSGEKRILGFNPENTSTYSDYVNDFLMDVAKNVVLISKNTPVIASVNVCNDFENIKTILKSLKDKGYSGVMNMPIAKDRQCMELWEKESELIEEAGKIGLFQIALITNEKQMERMCKTEVDTYIVMHNDIEKISEWVKVLKSKNKLVLVCKPDEKEVYNLVKIIKQTQADGVWGMEIFDSIPITNNFNQQIAEYQKLRVEKRGEIIE